MLDAPFLAGKLLLAMPGMADPRFERSVTALCVHDENGAVGIGISHKRAGIRLRGLLKQLGLEPGDAPDEAIHHGGPVEPGRGFVLHSDDWGGGDRLPAVGPRGRGGGGPVGAGRVVVRPGGGWGGEDPLQIVGPRGKRWAMTGTVDVLRAIAEKR